MKRTFAIVCILFLFAWPRWATARPDEQYHSKGGVYFGFALGSLTLHNATGTWTHLQSPAFAFAGYLGWSFNPWFAVEWAANVNLFYKKGPALRHTRETTLTSTLLNFRLRLARPTARTFAVPVIELGVGYGWLQSIVEVGPEGEEEARTLAKGWTGRAGFGLDVYVFRSFVLGFQIQYNLYDFSALDLGPMAGAGDGPTRRRTMVRALTFALRFTAGDPR
jgi:hypothetical protein